MNQDRSVSVSTAEVSAGSKNDGQPVPDSNLVSLRKSSAPQPAHRYTPEPCSSQYLPVNARSVPFSRRTWYSSGVSSARHSASVLSILLVMHGGYAGRPRPYQVAPGDILPRVSRQRGP